jgi:PAS domain S-box-containing protein
LSPSLDRAKETGPFGFVLKPFREKELLIAIDMALYRHAVERQVKTSERKYAATLASIGDAVIATDAFNRVSFMNPVAEELTGCSLADAHGLPIEDVFHVVRGANDRARIDPSGEALRSGRVVRFEAVPLFLVSRTNGAIPIADCAAPIVDDQGVTTGAVIAFRDVRDRHLAEVEPGRAQKQLVESRTMESIGRLAAGIGHNFNNFLTVINGCSELALCDETLAPTTRELITDVLKAGERAADITKQFVAFGRRQKLNPEPVDLNVLLTAVSATLRRLITDQIAFDVRATQESLIVFADPTQLEQVIASLVVNARDAMPQGGTLTLCTARGSVEAGSLTADGAEPGDYATLTVSDTGHGIAESALDHIFEPFFTTKEVGHNTGLGLAVVYNVVSQSGGFIRVHSQPDRGATFVVYLPIADRVAGRVVTDRSQTVVGPTAGTAIILVVENEHAVRSFVVAVLRRIGYSVIEAADHHEALAKLREHGGSVDLLVTDVVMPPTTQGPSLAAQLFESNRRIPVLYISSYLQSLGSLGNAMLLRKPFTASVLIDKVRHLLG